MSLPNPISMVSATQVADLLSRFRFTCHDEAALQAAIARVLEEASIPFEREVDLRVPGDSDDPAGFLPEGAILLPTARESPDAGRIDFLIGRRVGLEVKVEGGVSAVARQLARYAASKRVRELVLATTRALYAPIDGARFDGKTVRVVRLAGGFL